MSFRFNLVMTLLLGAMVVQRIQPGLEMVRKQPELF